MDTLSNIGSTIGAGANEFRNVHEWIKPTFAPNASLISQTGPLWRQPPHLHEYSLAAAYVRCMEKSLAGEPFTEDDVNAVWSLLDKTLSYEEKQVTQGQPSTRKLPPVMLSNDYKQVLRDQLARLGDADFTQGANWQNEFLACLEGNVSFLIYKDLFTIGTLHQLQAQIKIPQKVQST